MAPARSQKARNSGASSTQQGTRTVAIQSPNTPERDARPEGPRITAAQKQALIDNLQLEVSERARKLRAQYALHAQGLRSRLEMRVNRIPLSLRSTSVNDLINLYAEDLAPPKPRTVHASKTASSRPNTASSHTTSLQTSSPGRKLKRNSSEMMGQSDKENDFQGHLDLPKKRTKFASHEDSKAPARIVSRKIDPNTVLSPKSHNSRTLLHSPFKSVVSPGRPRPSRPASPGKAGASTASLAAAIVNGIRSTTAKSAAPTRTASRTAANTASTRGRKEAMAPPPVPASRSTRKRKSDSSHTSESSAQTTIVKRTGVVRKAVSKATQLTASATGRRTAAKKDGTPAPTAGGTVGRVLRSRR